MPTLLRYAITSLLITLPITTAQRPQNHQDDHRDSPTDGTSGMQGSESMADWYTNDFATGSIYECDGEPCGLASLSISGAGPGSGATEASGPGVATGPGGDDYSATSDIPPSTTSILDSETGSVTSTPATTSEPAVTGTSGEESNGAENLKWGVRESLAVVMIWGVYLLL